jgi:hypothetical protein
MLAATFIYFDNQHKSFSTSSLESFELTAKNQLPEKLFFFVKVFTIKTGTRRDNSLGRPLYILWLRLDGQLIRLFFLL